MNKNWVILTGSEGGIGKVINSELQKKGYNIIGIDKVEQSNLKNNNPYIKCDLSQLSSDVDNIQNLKHKVNQITNGGKVKFIIHNAAIQIVKPFEELSIFDWQQTLNVNLLAPIQLNLLFINDLKSSKGSIINVSSIHANLTKKEFSAYSTSKAALSGLSKSLSVELGKNIRVNAIEPAAIETSMLKKGLKKNETLFRELNTFHPTGSIGSPYDVSRAIIFLMDEKNSFLNGVTLSLSGGIHNCLSDPSI